MTARTQQNIAGDMITNVGVEVFYGEDLAHRFCTAMQIKADKAGAKLNFRVKVVREKTAEDCGIYEVEVNYLERDERAYEMLRDFMAAL